MGPFGHVTELVVDKPVNRAAGGVRARTRSARQVHSLHRPARPGPCAAAASAIARRTECRDHPGPAERASSWRMASQPPLEPASAPPPSSLASFLQAATRGSPAVAPHLRRIVPERLESKYACTVNSLLDGTKGRLNWVGHSRNSECWTLGRVKNYGK